MKPILALADFVAGVAVKNALDMERTVQELRPELPTAQAAIIADKLEHDPNVQQAIQKTLEKRGLDNKSKEHYVDLLWKYAESEKPEDEKRQLQSLRILGKAFIAEQISVDKPETLPLGGRFKEGLERMGLGDEVVGKLSAAPEIDLDEDDETARFDA